MFSVQKSCWAYERVNMIPNSEDSRTSETTPATDKRKNDRPHSESLCQIYFGLLHHLPILISCGLRSFKMFCAGITGIGQSELTRTERRLQEMTGVQWCPVTIHAVFYATWTTETTGCLGKIYQICSKPPRPTTATAAQLGQK